MKRHSFRKFIFPLVISLVSTPLFADGLNAFLGSENAQVGICGNMPVERKRRDCLKSTDLKQCLELDRSNPLYVMSQDREENFLCINTSSTTGSQIIEEMVSSSLEMCLSENVNSFYSDIIENPEFQEISQQFKESLGIPLKLNYAIDTLNSVSSIQLDLREFRGPGQGEEDITLNVSPYSQSAPCLKINSKNILKKVSQELARLTIKRGTEESQLYGEKRDNSRRVFDASRFGVAQKEEEGLKEADRKMASER
ncbi:MAG: hypothetical protein VXV96_06820 [Bdellovibrionota bacterium]|nr:hypothetical protein [Bdellovibrionota bacterium]